MDEKIKVSDLVFDKNNANRGTPRGRGMLEKSLQKYGAGRSILLDKNNRIIAGNKTAATAGEIGLTNVRVVESDGTEIIAVKRTDIDLDSKQGRALAVADNRVAEVDLAWNAEELLAEKEDGVPIMDFFTEDEIDELVDKTVGGGLGDGDGQIPEKLGDLLAGLVYRPTWNKKRGVRFLSCRKWSEKDKKKTLDTFKALKYSCDSDMVQFVSGEIIACLLNFIFPQKNQIVVTAPPPGASVFREDSRGHFATKVAEQVAVMLGARFEAVFQPRPKKRSSSPRNYAERGEMLFQKELEESVFYILVDDVATSGTTIEECATLIGKTNMVLPVAWIYENCDSTDLNGIIDSVECAA